jgi:hypothetical protein
MSKKIAASRHGKICHRMFAGMTKVELQESVTKFGKRDWNCSFVHIKMQVDEFHTMS